MPFAQSGNESHGRAALEGAEVTARAERRDTREALERTEVTADTERRDAREPWSGPR